MTEYYISEEQAAQFVNIGFDVKSWEELCYSVMVNETNSFKAPKLRLDQAAKWLREQPRLHIDVDAGIFDDDEQPWYSYQIEDLKNGGEAIHTGDMNKYSSYEDALSVAISETLKIARQNV